MDDAIGGRCPSCEGEFQPGVTECPDCGVALLAPGEEPPGPEESAVTEPTDPWPLRLDVIALLTAFVVLVLFACGVVAALSLNFGDEQDFLRYQRLQLAAQVGDVGFATLLLFGALAIAIRRWLRPDDWLPDRRTWLVELAVASAAVIVGLSALVGVLNDVWPGTDRFPGAFQWLSIGRGIGAVATAAVALWLAAPER